MNANTAPDTVSFRLQEGYAGKWDWRKYTHLFDIHTAKKYLPLLAAMHEQRQGIFAGLEAPQLRWYPHHLNGNKTKLSLWLFFGALFMRAGVKSNTVLYWIREFAKAAPELFQPKYIVNNLSSPHAIERAIVYAFPHSPLAHKSEDYSKSWYKNAKTIVERYDGKPLRLWEGETNFYDVWRKVDPDYSGAIVTIRGMRKKIFSLLTMWMQDYSLVEKYLVPPPVDFHALRILFALEIIKHQYLVTPLKKDRGRKNPYPPALLARPSWRLHDRMRDITADFLYDFCLDEKVNPYHLSHALWHLSETLCARHPQAQVQRPKDLDPVYTFYDDLDKKPNSWPRNYQDRCLLCPLEKDCGWIFASQPHYVYGLLVPDRRARHPLSENLLARPDTRGKLVLKRGFYNRNGTIHDTSETPQLELDLIKKQ